MTLPPLTVRTATSDDISALLDLIQSAYRGGPSRAGWTTEADLIDGSRTDAELLTADLADPATTILVADGDGGLQGCCAVAVGAAGTAYFGTFAVRPTRQRTGTGSHLLAVAEDHARAAGAGRMEMTVLVQRTELLAWYARRGYTDTGQTRPFPYGDERYGRPRRDDLVFTVLTKPLSRGS